MNAAALPEEVSTVEYVDRYRPRMIFDVQRLVPRPCDRLMVTSANRRPFRPGFRLSNCGGSVQLQRPGAQPGARLFRA